MTGDSSFDFMSFLIGIAVCYTILIILLGCLGNLDSQLSKETKNDICLHLTNQTSVFHVEHGKLICEVPSYDSTTNIIVRKTGEKSND